jgi:predicted nucleotidyltransferase
MTSLLSKHSAALHSLFRAHHVVKADVFGSALGPGFSPSSDVDLLITFDSNIALLDYADNYFALKEKLELLLERQVDLVSSRSLKNPVLIESINRTKQRLYAA